MTLLTWLGYKARIIWGHGKGSNGFCLRLAVFEVPMPLQGMDTPRAVRNQNEVWKKGQNWRIS